MMKATRLYTLLALLLMAGRVMQAQDYENWDEIVTEQPEGYVVDAEGNVEISTPEGLAWLTGVVNELNGCTPDNFDGRTITLMCDLNMSQYGPRNLKPISRRNRPFMGTFDGAGYGLDGLILNFPTINESSNSDMALFGYLLHGTVKNLTINSGFYKYVHAEGTWYDAVLVAVADSLSLVDNCICQMRNIGAMNPAGENYMGGVVGLNRNSTVRNCAYVMGEYDLGFARNGGGIVCRNLSEGGYAPALVVNCFFYGKMIGSYGVRNAGGIVCFNEGDISPDNKGYSAIVSNCYSELLGPLFGLQDQGCIVAYNNKGGIVENCFADLSTQNYVGLFGSDYGFINNCTSFIAEGGDGVLEEPVGIGQGETSIMLQALNYWVESQEEFGIYNTWLAGTQIPVPEFGAVYDGIEEAHDNGLKMAVAYPNPGRNTLNIRTGLQDARVEVYDLNGRMVYRQDITENVTAINTTNWSEGTYVWKVYTGVSTLRQAQGSTTLAETGKWIKK